MIQKVLVILTLLIVVFFITRKFVLIFKDKDRTCYCDKDKCASCPYCNKNNMKIDI